LNIDEVVGTIGKDSMARTEREEENDRDTESGFDSKSIGKTNFGGGQL